MKDWLKLKWCKIAHRRHWKDCSSRNSEAYYCFTCKAYRNVSINLKWNDTGQTVPGEIRHNEATGLLETWTGKRWAVISTPTNSTGPR